MSTAQSDITSLTTRITTEESNVDTLQDKTQLLTSTADTATFSGKVAWGTDKFFCIKAREEVSVADSATLTKVMDLSHSYSIDGNSSNHIATYDVTVQDKAGSISSPYFKATLIIGSDGSVLVPITSFKVSTHTFDYTTSTLTLGFSESISKDLIISWCLSS